MDKWPKRNTLDGWAKMLMRYKTDKDEQDYYYYYSLSNGFLDIQNETTNEIFHLAVCYRHSLRGEVEIRKESGEQITEEDDKALYHYYNSVKIVYSAYITIDGCASNRKRQKYLTDVTFKFLDGDINKDECKNYIIGGYCYFDGLIDGGVSYHSRIYNKEIYIRSVKELIRLNTSRIHWGNTALPFDKSKNSTESFYVYVIQPLFGKNINNDNMLEESREAVKYLADKFKIVSGQNVTVEEMNTKILFS